MEIGPPKNRSNRRIKIHKRENDLKRFQNGTFLAEMRKITKFALRARFLQKWSVFARNMLKRLRQIFDETIFSTEGDLDRSYREFPDPHRGYYAFMFHTEWASGLLHEKFPQEIDVSMHVYALFIRRYRGYCPQLKYECGHTYGIATDKLTTVS